MKKLMLVIILLLLIIIVILLYCNCRKCKDNGKPGTTFCKGADCYESTGTPDDMISFNLAMSMSQDYARDLGKRYVWEGDVRTDSMDGRSIWFDLKKMKQFIGYIEQSLCRNKCNDSTALGIRFYYAKYPDAQSMDSYDNLDGVPRIFARKHTLFMVPTYWNGHANIDFDPNQIGANCYLHPIDTSSGSNSMVWMALPGGEGDELNHGSLMPPPAGAGSFPTTQDE